MAGQPFTLVSFFNLFKILDFILFFKEKVVSDFFSKKIRQIKIKLLVEDAISFVMATFCDLLHVQ